jgi:hypothetical protein
MSMTWSSRRAPRRSRGIGDPMMPVTLFGSSTFQVDLRAG